MKKGFFLLLVVLFLLSFPLSVSASNYHGVTIIGETTLPADFQFSSSDTCTGHTSFKHATARDDGGYAVCSLYTNAREDLSQVYNKHYVDIYDSNGEFVIELSYCTDLDNAVELTDEFLHIYFQTIIVSYNLNNGSLICYSIPSGATVDNGLLLELRSDTFSAGQWTYVCKGGWTEHTKLVRTNGIETQVLVEYGILDSSVQLIDLAFPCLLLFIALSVVLVFFIIRKYARKK